MEGFMLRGCVWSYRDNERCDEKDIKICVSEIDVFYILIGFDMIVCNLLSYFIFVYFFFVVYVCVNMLFSIVELIL